MTAGEIRVVLTTVLRVSNYTRLILFKIFFLHISVFMKDAYQ